MDEEIPTRVWNKLLIITWPMVRCDLVWLKIETEVKFISLFVLLRASVTSRRYIYTTQWVSGKHAIASPITPSLNKSY